MRTELDASQEGQSADPIPADSPDVPALSPDEYQAAHGEPLAHTLDLNTWQGGADLVRMYQRLEEEIAAAVQLENELQKRIRDEIFPLLRTRPGAPPNAGVYQATVRDMQKVHEKLLFNGAVEACDGTVASHDTLPLTVTQIGVCLVSYRGDQGSWVHRIFRRDLRTSASRNPIDETVDLLERRRRRGGIDQPNARDRLSDLARRGIMAFAERAVLLDRSSAAWRMGHGNPTPYELITGSGMPDLLTASLELLSRLILQHKRFVFVPSAPSRRELLTIGNALQPLEYAIVDTNYDNLERISEGHYRGESWGKLGDKVDKFVKECGSKIAVGLYRASNLAPSQMFFSHIDHAHEAALIAMADSVLQEHRGFPMLIDLADTICGAAFGSDVFTASTQLAYTAAGTPFRYMAERRTR